MPILENVDLTTVSTKNEPYPEGEYSVTIKESEVRKQGKEIIFKHRIDAPEKFQGREIWDFVNLKQNDGKRNEIGWKRVKKYLEVCFGEGSEQAELTPPNTDLCNAQRCKLYVVINSYTDEQTKEEKTNNKISRVMAA